jgi:hypothetical protein
MPPIERIFSSMEVQDNLYMWGKLFIDKTGQGDNGWLVDSWSENGEPYWVARLNWVKAIDKTIHAVQMSVGQMDIYPEDTEIEPERAKFILETIKKFERKWMEQERIF